ncbi:MAG: MarR family winged helix-turn-helix transcriptional regulator [Nesterenkonia sp.]
MPSDAHDLALAVARLNRRMRRERRSELTPTQLSVLGAVALLGPATPGAIAAHEQVKPPSVTRILNQLTETGYIRRVAHPEDGRQVLVEISAGGHSWLAQERQRRDAWLHEQLQKLHPDERDLLRAAAPVLKRLAEAE